MVEYILSLANEEKVVSLPLNGKANFAVVPPPGPAATSAYVLTVTYDDNGANGMPSLSTTKQFMFKSPVLNGMDATDLKGGVRKLAAYGILENVKHNSSVTFADVDLTGITKLNFVIAEMEPMKSGVIEVKLDNAEGTSLGTVSFANAPKMPVQAGVFMRPSGMAIKGVTGKHNIILVFKNDKAGDENLFMFSQMSLGK